MQNLITKFVERKAKKLTITTKSSKFPAFYFNRNLHYINATCKNDLQHLNVAGFKSFEKHVVETLSRFDETRLATAFEGKKN